MKMSGKMRQMKHNGGRFPRLEIEVPCKISKIDEVNESTANDEKDEIKKISGSLTAEEIVGRNMDLMNLIIRNIDNMNDRKQISLSCKAFNLLCNQKKSFADPFKYKIEKISLLNYRMQEPLFILFDNTLVVNISHVSRSNTRKLESFKRHIIGNRYKLKTIKIRNLPSGYFYYFKELNCFENISTLYFDNLKIEYIPMAIFSECSSLKPEIIVFGNVRMNIFNYEDPVKALYGDNSKYTFPKGIKQIHLVSKADNFDWIVGALQNYKPKEIESLVIGKNFTLNLNQFYLKSIGSIGKYFKSIQILVHRNMHIFSGNYLIEILGGQGPLEIVDLTFDINFNDFNGNFNSLTNPNHLVDGVNNITNGQSHVNPLYEDIFLRIHTLNIASSNLSFPYRLSNVEIVSFNDRFLKMRNLSTLTIDYDLIGNTSYFKSLCSGMSSTIKNFKLFKCELLMMEDLKNLASRCFNIENLCLDNVSSKDITIKNIISLFSKLKGLKINFNLNYKVLSILQDLIKMNEYKCHYVLDWSNIYYLNIICNYPSLKESYLLSEIERTTPRRAGRFLMTEQPRSIFNDSFQIIIQHDTNYHSYFESIFNYTYIF